VAAEQCPHRYSWVSYQLFQPISVQAAIIANAFEA